MSNSNSLRIGQPLTLNKLYSHCNLNYSYFTQYSPSTLWYFLLFTPTFGLNPYLSYIENFFVQNVFLNIFSSHHKSFLFQKQTILKTNKLTLIYKVNPLFKTKEFKKIHNTHHKLFNYVSHNPFASYKRHFLSSSVQLFSPFIRKKSRVFPFSSKSFSKKLLKTQRLKKKIFYYRKF